MSESPLKLEWAEVLRRLESAGVIVVEAENGLRYLRRQVGKQVYWHHLPQTLNLSLPVGPYVLGSLCDALNLDPVIFEDPERS